MCTVIFLPTPEGPVFSSCRDENPLRPSAQLPEVICGHTGLLTKPCDGDTKGTWIGMHSNGHVLILLNGAFVKHQKKSNYRKSRGLIVSELLDDLSPRTSWEQINLQEIEPFTVVLWQEQQLYELVWDGKIKLDKLLSVGEPQLWSSCTLYANEVQQKRRQWLEHVWNSGQLANAPSLLQLLQSHNDPENGFVMCRNAQMQTISISLVSLKQESFSFQYHDLLTTSETNVWLKPAKQNKLI